MIDEAADNQAFEAATGRFVTVLENWIEKLLEQRLAAERAAIGAEMGQELGKIDAKIRELTVSVAKLQGLERARPKPTVQRD